MKPAFLGLCACLSCLACGAASAGTLRPDHPVIGTWKLALPGSSCAEIYRVRGDGSSQVSSAEQRGESEIEISDQPNAGGFYKWVDKVVKDNGKKDCSGEIAVIGHSATNYIIFDPAGEKFFACQEENFKSCIGPFVRIKGEGS